MLFEDHLSLGFVRPVSHKFSVTNDLSLFIGTVSLYLMSSSYLPLVHSDRLHLNSPLLLARLNGTKSLILVALRRIQEEFFFLESIDCLQEVFSIGIVFGAQVL